jgi:type VI secretion system protein ImpA
MDPVFSAFCGPVSADNAGGEDLHASGFIAVLDALRLFGRLAPFADEVDWRSLKGTCIEGLSKSRDLRVLAHLTAAALRTDGLAALEDSAAVAAFWLNDFPDAVYPLIDDDAIERRNALSCLADRMAIVDALRRLPLARHAQFGAVSLRDIDIADGKLAPSSDDAESPSEAQIIAVFSDAPIEDLQQVVASVAATTASLRQIDAMMRDSGGSEAAPDFDPLLDTLGRIDKFVAARIAERQPAVADEAETEGQVGTTKPGAGSGLTAIGSRHDAIRALEAVAQYFRNTEPSSPVPLFVERAKRLVAKDFLEVLKDIAPDALAQARHVGGIKGEGE